MNKLSNEFPPFEEGVIIIQNKKCNISLSEGMKALSGIPSLFKNASINMKIKEVEKFEKLYKIDLKCDITAELLNQNLNFTSFDEHQSLFQYEIGHLTEWKSGGTVISKDIMIFSLGEKECKNYEGWIKADLDFIKELVFTSDNDNWFPILSSRSPQSFTILFMSKEVEKRYRYTAVKRILLTPFSIIADLFITPILIFGGPPA